MQASGIQKFFCKHCKKYQQGKYSKNAWLPGTGDRIRNLLVEGVSLRGIARILKIGLSTVMQKIRLIASRLTRPIQKVSGHVYEIDELWTFVGSKLNETWLMYGWDRTTKQVVNFKIGSRTRENLKEITETVIGLNPGKICTDGLKAYPGLIPRTIHKTNPMATRHIERFNLNLRTHLKRLSRKTICFSKSEEMLEACLKIYFWGRRPLM